MVRFQFCKNGCASPGKCCEAVPEAGDHCDHDRHRQPRVEDHPQRHDRARVASLGEDEGHVQDDAEEVQEGGGGADVGVAGVGVAWEIDFTCRVVQSDLPS